MARPFRGPGHFALGRVTLPAMRTYGKAAIAACAVVLAACSSSHGDPKATVRTCVSAIETDRMGGHASVKHDCRGLTPHQVARAALIAARECASGVCIPGGSS